MTFIYIIAIVLLGSGFSLDLFLQRAAWVKAKFTKTPPAA